MVSPFFHVNKIKKTIFLIIVKLAISNWKRKKYLKKSDLKMLRLFIPLFLVLILRSFARQKNFASNVRLAFFSSVLL